MIRPLIIIWISASLISSLAGGLSKLAKQPNEQLEPIYQLSEQISSLEQKLQDIETKSGEQPHVQSDLERLKGQINLKLEEASQEQQWDWWEEGLKPVLLCAFLWVIIRNKQLFIDVSEVTPNLVT